MNPLQEAATLHNGVEIPRFGFGTSFIENGPPVKQAVITALEVGFRHIDTAKAYNNEQGVGEAIAASSIPREELFLAGKLWNKDQGFYSALRAFEATLQRLQTDYLDLYLIHWPKNRSTESWRALLKLYEDRRVKAIGVSNFTIGNIEELISETGIVPMVNQVELHPRFNQRELREYCSLKHIAIEAWGSFMQGKIFSDPLLQELAESYGKTIAQIILRWQYQLGVICLPKSENTERIRTNVDIFDFSLTDEDIARIETLEQLRVGPDPEMLNY
jgi:methylglyoxal/glyoxal reductase